MKNREIEELYSIQDRVLDIVFAIGRDNPKDIFDIYLIAKFRIFDWKDIIKSVREKLVFTIHYRGHQQ